MRFAALALFAVSVPALAQQPSTDEIRDTMDEILAQPIYEELEMRRFGFDFSWFFDPIFDLFEKWMKALQSMIGGLPAELEYAVYALLIAVSVGLIIHIVYTIRKAVQPPDIGPIIIDEGGPAPAHVLEARSRALAEEGNYVDASRTLLVAAFALLEETRHGRVRRGLTTSEYLNTFTADWVVENLRVFVDLINWKWYRARSFDASDYAQCRQAYDAIETRLNEEFS